jgi:hypothetical protein
MNGPKFLCPLDRAIPALRKRLGSRVAVASGDGIFADLAEVSELEVVVPVEHHGVASRLQPYSRVRGSNGPSADVLTQVANDFSLGA